jgi:ABC-2 type transport system ATP-binding protein
VSANAFEVLNLVKRYRPDSPPVTDHMTLDIGVGEVFGLLGPNGSGKSTLVRQLAGLLRPTSGSIRLFGHDVVREPARASQFIALQPQGLALPSQATPRELLRLTGRLRGLSAPSAREHAETLLSELNLSACADGRIARLSGGQQRLTSIAAALIGDRPVLIFDEPTNELDPEIRRTVWERIRRSARSGKTVILVTHNVVEAEQALDRVAIVRHGQILALGTPGDLKAKVSQSVRLELSFSHAASEAAPALLEGMQGVQQYGARRYNVIVPRHETEAAISHILPGLNLLDDFRIITPNLEDVYLELTGGESHAGSR